MPGILDFLKNSILRSCFLLCISCAGSLGCVLPLLSTVGALPHALNMSLLSFCQLCQVWFIFCKCRIDSFGRFMDLPHTSCDLIWKIKKWISSTTCSSIFASKRVYGGTEQISIDIQFLLSICLISGGQKFF